MSSFRKFWITFSQQEPKEYFRLYEWTVLLSFLFLALATYRVWGFERSYPVLSYFQGFDASLAVQQRLVSLTALFLFLCFFVKKLWPYLLFGIGLVFLMLFDVLRIQPYFYEFGLLIVLLGFYHSSKDQEKKSQILFVSQLVLVAMYIWTGIQKFNIHFFTGVGPWFFSPFGSENIATVATYLAPFFEISLGVSLLSKKLRPYAVWVGMVFHAVVLVIISPLFLSWNSTAMLWDFLQIPLLFLLFYPDDKHSFADLKVLKNSVLSILVCILVGILPVLSFWQIWPQYLSWHMYAGKDPRAYLLIPPEHVNSLPADVQQYLVYNESSEGYQLSFLHWSMNTLSIAPFPEESSYFRMFSGICQSASPELSMILVRKPSLIDPEIQQLEVSCTQAALMGN